MVKDVEKEQKVEKEENADEAPFLVSFQNFSEKNQNNCDTFRDFLDSPVKNKEKSFFIILAI